MLAVPQTAAPESARGSVKRARAPTLAVRRRPFAAPRRVSRSAGGWRCARCDIDVLEGIAARLFHVETILIELGDSKSSKAFFCIDPRHKSCKLATSLRGASFDDVQRLQREFGYSVYRLRTHT